MTRHQEYYKANRSRELARKRVNNKHTQTIRREMLNIIKTEVGCQTCGYDKHPAALDFHHRDPSVKKGNVTRFACGSIRILQAEINKCDVICANCHRELEAA